MISQYSDVHEHGAEYEFDAEQNQVLSQLANSLRWTSAPMVSLGFLVLIDLAMYSFWMYRHHGLDNLQLVAMPMFLLGMAALFIFMGLLTGKASMAFRQVVETRGSDVYHLMDGINGLNSVFGVIAGFVKAMVLLTFLALVLNLIWVYTSRDQPARSTVEAATWSSRY
jgi:hypothetical protein